MNIKSFKEILAKQPFLLISFAPLLSFFMSSIVTSILIVTWMVIPEKMTDTKLMMNLTNMLFDLETLIILPITIILAIPSIGMGFSRKENRKGLLLSILINSFFLIFLISNFLAMATFSQIYLQS